MATDNHKCSAKCRDLEHVKSEDVSYSAKVFLNAEEMGYKDVVVQTTHEAILKMVEEPKKDCINAMRGAWKATRNIDIDKIYNEKGQAWQDFCDDVAIYYAARFKATDKLIPICGVPNDLD